jgi:hypothetical protein
MAGGRPEVVFDISMVFHRHFVYGKESSPGDRRKLKLCKGRIERLFRENETGIMESLQEMLGATTEREIRVWIVDNAMKAPSMSKPLLLKCKRSTGLMLYVLVHELAHRHLDAGVRWEGKRSGWLKPGIRLEALCNVAAERALGAEFMNMLGSEVNKINGYEKTKAFSVKNMPKICRFLGEANDS